MAGKKKKKLRRNGTIDTRSPNVHLVRVYKGRDEAGKRVYVSETVHGTISQAQDKLASMVTARSTGKLVGRSPLLLKDYLKHWLEKEVSISCAPATYMNYSYRITKWECLGWKRLTSITQADVQSAITKLALEAEHAPGTIWSIFVLLHTALERAVERKLIASNPCYKIVVPKEQSEGVDEDMKVLTKEQVRLFLESTREDKMWPLWVFLFSTGCRPGEALGLKWTDLDLDKGEVRIRRSLSRRLNQKDEPGMQWALKDVKTKRGRRTITIPQETCDALRKLRAQQTREILEAGPLYTRHDLVFASEIGDHLNAVYMLHRFQRHLTKAGLPKMRLYDCRHTHITLLLEAGENPEVVSKRAGHASVAFTLKTYFHATPVMVAHTATKVSDMFFAPPKLRVI